MKKDFLNSYFSFFLISSVLFFSIPPIAFAQSDLIIDLDGIATKGIGTDADKEVSPNDPLVAWPTGFPPVGSRAGIDWIDRDQPASRTWTRGDSLFSEDPNTCGGSNRDQRFNVGIDCVILEGPLGPIPNNLLTDCDLETGGSPSSHFPIIPCQDTRPNVSLSFFDTDGDGFWSDGEDIVLDLDGDGIFDVTLPVGGELVPIDTTMVLVGGTYSTVSWLVPVIISAIGVSFVIFRKNS